MTEPQIEKHHAYKNNNKYSVTTMASLITGLELGNHRWAGFFQVKTHFREKCFKRAEILTQVVKTLFIYKNRKKSKKKIYRVARGP